MTKDLNSTYLLVTGYHLYGSNYLFILIAGLKITASQRTMTGQNKHIVKRPSKFRNVRSKIVLNGHLVWPLTGCYFEACHTKQTVLLSFVLITPCLTEISEEEQ